MPGEVDALYRLARSVLLDALDALGHQRDAVVLVGAQAVYLHAGEGDLQVPPFTKDADLAIDPAQLHDEPLLVKALGDAGFRPGDHPGTWLGRSDVPVDLLVPKPLGGPGRRGARLGVHGKRAARKVAGLEGALVDFAPIQIASFDSDDTRTFSVKVASPAALLVSKLHKIADRVAAPDRLNDKDALDVFRLLRAQSTEEMAAGFARMLADPLSLVPCRRARSDLKTLFGDPNSAGVMMLERAVTTLDDPEFFVQSCAILASDLFAEIREL